MSRIMRRSADSVGGSVAASPHAGTSRRERARARAAAETGRATGLPIRAFERSRGADPCPAGTFAWLGAGRRRHDGPTPYTNLRVSPPLAIRAMAWLVAVTLLSGPMPVLAEERSGFTVGIVEANGNLVPVATFDGSDWSSPWPLDLVLDQDLPEWPDVPAEWHRGGGSLRDWTLWFENLGPSPSHDHYSLDWPSEMIPSNTALVANGFLISNMHCSKTFALSTNESDLTAVLLEGLSRC